MTRLPFTVVNVLRHMERLQPEPLDVMETIQLSGWGLAALRHCLVSLEGAGIIRFLGRDRWRLVPEYSDAKMAVEGARRAGVDVDRLRK
jgi:DNA-binding IclR family transcriptional regulator